MAFVDEIKVFMKAGRGGDGVVRWLHEKGKEFGGPSGGDGGRGGSIQARGQRNLNLLTRYQYKNKFVAEDGDAGAKKSMHGKDGSDLVLDVPVGTVIHNLETGKSHQILSEGETILLLSGGKGGRGNESFKSSRNVKPIEATPGAEGEEGNFLIELQLIADAGFVGLPNAGKSSLLNVLTRAQAKVGSYAFTTLYPNLGDLYGFILADIPGLIEGASAGKGLGFAFLRHVRRTNLVLHCVSLENEDVRSTYDTIRKELSVYGGGLEEKPEIIILTKSDLVSAEAVDLAREKMLKVTPHVFVVSIYDRDSTKHFQDGLISLLRGKS